MLDLILIFATAAVTAVLCLVQLPEMLFLALLGLFFVLLITLLGLFFVLLITLLVRAIRSTEEL